MICLLPSLDLKINTCFFQNLINPLQQLGTGGNYFVQFLSKLHSIRVFFLFPHLIKSDTEMKHLLLSDLPALEMKDGQNG
jgi:hypothetical protein